MAVEAPPRWIKQLRAPAHSVGVPEDAKNDVESLKEIAATGGDGVDLGKLSREEFFRHFGLQA